MKERAFLIASVVVLFGGLGVWGVVAERGRPGTRGLVPRLPAPPIGQVVDPDDPSAVHERRTLERTMLAGVPLVRFFERGTVPVLGIVVTGRDAVGVHERLQAVAGETGRFPIVLGDAWSVAGHADAMRTTVDGAKAIIARAQRVDVDAWITARLADAPPARGSWPEDVEPERERFSLVRYPMIDLPLPEIAIALLPMQSSSEAPAWLAFGNWRGCPEPAVHVAVLARWRQRFGAEMVTMGPDAIELRVARPPADREAAFAIAREHAAYAPSLLAAPGATLEELGASRIGAPVWRFHWPRGAAASE